MLLTVGAGGLLTLVAWLADSGGLGDLHASWPTLGAGGILGLGVIALITGRGLATRREVDEANKRTEEANRRADKWEQVALEALGQNRKLLATSEVTEQVMDALSKALESKPAHDPGRSQDAL